MYQLKGIIRGIYSPMQDLFEKDADPAVIVISGETLEEVVVGYVLPEWIYTLSVKGKKIVDPVRYLKRKGLWNQCIREELA